MNLGSEVFDLAYKLVWGDLVAIEVGQGGWLLGFWLDGLVGAVQVAVAGEGVGQVEMGWEANVVHMGGEAGLGWVGHMAMSTLQGYMGGEGVHLGVLQVYMGAEWAHMGVVEVEVGAGQAVGGEGEGGGVVEGEGGRGGPEHWVGLHQ